MRGIAVRIGWLADKAFAGVGGAELSSAHLATHAPKGIEVIPCPPGEVEECDGYIIQNCVRYPAETIEAIKDKPIVKSVRDYWQTGDADLREYLLHHARVLIFNSPLHRENFEHELTTEVRLCPPPIPTERFSPLRREVGYGGEACWIGRMYPEKGVLNAMRWAGRNKVQTDFYGFGPLRPGKAPYVQYCGPARYDLVPTIMASYERFVFLPNWKEPFGRTVAEAWVAGCRLEVNENIGALWWIEHEPQTIYLANERFWEIARFYLHD